MDSNDSIDRRFGALFSQSPLSTQLLAPDGTTLKVNDAWLRLWEVTQDDFEKDFLGVYNVLEDRMLAKAGIRDELLKAFAGEPVRLPTIAYDPAEIGRPGRVRWVEAFAFPIKSADGAVTEVVLMHQDVTERAEAERTLHLLAETSELSLGRENFETKLERMAVLAAQPFGGWCVVHAKEGRKLVTKVVAHSDPEMLAVAKKATKLSEPNIDDPGGVAEVVRSGKPQIVEHIPPESIGMNSLSDEYRELLRQLGLRSYISVPLFLGREVWGALTFVSATKSYYEGDLQLATELASRISINLKNAALYDEAQRAIAAREDFLSIASHELKTPLTPLRLQLQTLELLIENKRLSEYSEADIRKLVTSPLKQLEDLNRLIDQLLDVSRIVAGRVDFKRTRCDFFELPHKVVSRFSEQLENAGCTVQIVGAGPIEGVWDCDRLEQVVTNLLTNAMKYGPGKPIEIQLDQLNDKLRFSVRDHGPGVHPEDRERIFGRFERASSTASVRGLGLGLFICHEIVTAHDGRIYLEDIEGEGAKFTVELPMGSG